MHTFQFQTPQKGSQWWGTFAFDGPAFDWGPESARPATALKDLVIYEMSVRCFTAAESSGVAPERRGTYLGVVDKVRTVVCALCVLYATMLCASVAGGWVSGCVQWGVF